MQLSHALSLSVLVFGIGACGDSEPAGGDPAAGGKGGEGGASSGSAGSTSAAGGIGGVGATGATGGTSTSTTGSTTGSGGFTGIPCTPPQDGVSTTPTAGKCEANVAVTCGNDGYLIDAVCGASQSCVVYEVNEYLYDSSGQLGWMETRTFDWAGCIPDEAAPCSLEFNGNYYEWGTDTPHCDGDSTAWCSPPTLPEYDFFDGQVFVGTTLGYFKTTPCDANETCYEPLSWEPNGVSDLKCLPVDATSCTTSGSACSGDTHVQCLGGYGVEEETDCSALGFSCFEGCASNPTAYCKPPSTQVCDPETHPQECTGPVSYNTCYDCLEEPHDCSTVLVIDWNTGNGMNLPGQCAITYGTPSCVLASATVCDQETTEGWCDGDVAKNCVGIVNEYDCAAVGQQCGVAGGVAGCKTPAALPCEDTFFGGSCNGNTLISCCPETGQNWMTNVPCVPGFDTETDCVASIPGGYCTDDGFFAECQTDDF